MVTFPSTSTEIGPGTDWGNIRIVYLLQSPFKYPFLIALSCSCCCSTWKLMVLMLYLKVSFAPVVYITTFTVSVAVVQFDGLTFTPVVI
jgi:hypothetical protein